MQEARQPQTEGQAAHPNAQPHPQRKEEGQVRDNQPKRSKREPPTDRSGKWGKVPGLNRGIKALERSLISRLESETHFHFPDFLYRNFEWQLESFIYLFVFSKQVEQLTTPVQNVIKI
jgi:hypothetical protein